MSAATQTHIQASRTEIERTVALLLEPGATTELRVPESKQRTMSGYFDDPGKLVDAAMRLSGQGPAVYFVPNPIKPDLQARANNRVVPYAKHTTSDDGILRRRMLLFDFDAPRPAGISATAREHEAGIARARDCRDFLRKMGFPEPALCDSGNGGHLQYRINLPADDNSLALVNACLQAADFQFTDDSVKVDTTVGNAARICKVYGTLVGKGDDMPERPHRLARILEAPPSLEVVSVELLRELAALAPTPDPPPLHANGSGNFDLPGWIAQHRLATYRQGPWQGGGYRWIFAECPWRPGDGTTAYIVQLANGAIKAACQHATCPGSHTSGNHWRELRAMYESAESRNKKPPVEAKPKPAGTNGTHETEDEADNVKDVNNVTGNIPYRADASGIWLRRNTRNGPIEEPITNFQARIVGALQEDDGAEVSSSFEIEAELNGRTYRFPVSAASFASMNWVPANMGPGAVVYAGMGIKDHARVAVQLLSKGVIEKRVYKHSGWCKLPNGEWVYLHAKGAIRGYRASRSEKAAFEDVHVELPDSLSRMVLPDPSDGQVRRDGIEAVLRLWDLGPDKVTIPLAAAPFRAAIGDVDFAVAIAGPSGVLKTEFAALDQQHFGAGFDARHLPASWSGTANSIEGLAFTAKDMILTVDDYAPQGAASDVHRLNALVDRVIRAQGNHSGRSRMRADGSLRPIKPPRGMILSTGEDLPPGKSLLGRMEVIDIQKGDISLERLSACQADAREGLYAQTMSNFLSWLADDYENHSRELREKVIKLRDVALAEHVAHRHARTPEITANLAAAIDLFLRFCVECGALSEEERAIRFKRAWAALVAVEAEQSGHQLQANPARRFLSLLRTALTSGRCHLAGADNGTPQGHEAYGWETISGSMLSASYARAKGDLVGWVDHDTGDAWLLPDAALATVKRLAQETHESFAVSRIALGKELNAQGLLTTTSLNTARPTLTVRKVLSGKSQEVWHMCFDDPEAIPLRKTDKVDNPDIAPPHWGANGVAPGVNAVG